MPKPKSKKSEDKQATLDRMLNLATTTNHLTNEGAIGGQKEPGTASPAVAAPEPAPEPALDGKQQEGEKEPAPTAPAREPAASAELPTNEPAARSVAEFEPIAESVAELAGESALPAEPVAAEPVAAGAAAEPAAALASVAPAKPAASQSASPQGEDDARDRGKGEHESETAHFKQAPPAGETNSAPALGAASLDLDSLFIPSSDKKTFTCRLTDDHYQYLLMLGTIVGNGTSPPDIVHNIIARFIDEHDEQIQKTMMKNMRQRRK